jgi:ADP-ribosylglycohydrolase
MKIIFTFNFHLEIFLDSKDFEEAIGEAIFIGGDRDTTAYLEGGMAKAFYGVMRREFV